MGKPKRSVNLEEGLVEDMPLEPQDMTQRLTTIEVPEQALVRVGSLEKELVQLRRDMDKAENHRRRETDRQFLDLHKEMETDTELDPYISQAGTSTQDVHRDMGPPPDRHPQGNYGIELPEIKGSQIAARIRLTTILRESKMSLPYVQEERFFRCHHTPQDEWIEIATTNMTGEATTHYLLFEHNNPEPTWEKYKVSLQLQFGDSTFIEYDEDLKNLVETSTVPEYKKRFERLAAMVRWPDEALIGAFKGGLRSDIKREMKIHRFDSLEECIDMARLYEERIEERKAKKKAHKVDKQRRKSSYPSGSRHNRKELVSYRKGNEQRPHSSSYSSNEEVIITGRRKSRVEKSEKRSERRNEKREEKEEAPPKEEKPPEAESLHSMQDPNKPDSFKVFGRINGKKILILLYNEATRNFLTEEAAQRCNVPKPTPDYHLEFLVIPLDGVDLILGMPWFFTLGIISWDVKNFSMTFTPDGDQESITLQGLTGVTSPKATLKALDTEQPACWGRNRHEVLVEWEGPDQGTSWEEFGSVAHRFPSTSARGQAQGREGDSVTDLPVGPDPVQAERPEPSHKKRKASELWARTLQCAVEDLPEEVNQAPKPVAEGGEGGAAKVEEVLGQDKSQGG
ncbi:hypothetical protein EJ110_NYTH59952, partial [Nymphaea thermarum]